jgi:hypothetical protein
VASYPHPGGPDYLALLSPVNGPNGGPKLVTSPRLDLDERNGSVTFGDEVNVAVPVPEPALKNAPALSGQPLLGDVLAMTAKDLIVG